ncbi:hypothetical protein [Actinoplanes sp. NBRC 103695]|uniref:hypothetical protein n=1 Tax=Actinoplanes sp. NBRC 103695 TaxID=3032202 RepID=UPI0024A33660|nr:hypothetical protein [Actinoplanes sp. NBRC 103695]GLY95919.1 hypothetical protein Acsp02_31740 [Actinoplanes sp. NBRC 103695]
MASGSARAIGTALPTYLISTALAVVVNFATDSWRSITPWVIVVVLVVVSALLAAATAGGQAQPDPGVLQWSQRPAIYGSPRPIPPRRNGARAVVAVVIVTVLVVSVFLVRFVFGYVTGRESGLDRLIEPVSSRTGALTLVVERVETTPHFTRVEMSAGNSGSDALTLPLYSNCQLTAGRTTKSADAFASEWPDNVPPDSTVSGVVVFRTVLPGEATKATVSFATIFGSLSTRGSVVVRNIPLREVTGAG